MTAPSPYGRASCAALLGLRLPLPTPLPHAALIALPEQQARTAHLNRVAASWTGGGLVALVDAPLDDLVGWPRLTLRVDLLDLLRQTGDLRSLAARVAHGHRAVISTATLRRESPAHDFSAALTLLASELGRLGVTTGNRTALLLHTSASLHLGDTLRWAMTSPGLHLTMWTPGPQTDVTAGWALAAAACNLVALSPSVLPDQDRRGLDQRLPSGPGTVRPDALAVGLGCAPAGTWLNRRWTWAAPVASGG